MAFATGISASSELEDPCVAPVCRANPERVAAVVEQSTQDRIAAAAASLEAPPTVRKNWTRERRMTTSPSPGHRRDQAPTYQRTRAIVANLWPYRLSGIVHCGH
jgi:hypothetical protein